MQKILALFVAVGLAALPLSAHAKTITLVADVWCPYNCERASEKQGFMVEIAREAFEKHGITVEYATMPWAQAIEETRSGKHTAIIGASINDAPDFIFPAIEQGWMNMQFFVAKDSRWNYSGKESLSRVALGVVSAYAYGPSIDSYIRTHRNDPSRIQVAGGDNVIAHNVDALLSGKVDAVLEDGHVMAYYLERSGLAGKVRKAGQLPVSDQNNLYIAFSPKDKSAKKYAFLLADEIAAMRTNGKLKEILDRYAIGDWRR